jgi:hypothetical protein
MNRPPTPTNGKGCGPWYVETDKLLETRLPRFQRYYRVTILTVINAFPTFSLSLGTRRGFVFITRPLLSTETAFKLKATARERHDHSPKGSGAVFETLVVAIARPQAPGSIEWRNDLKALIIRSAAVPLPATRVGRRETSVAMRARSLS